MKPFEPKHVVTMVVAVCAAVIAVGMPLAVHATAPPATTIYDATGVRSAAVSSLSALKVDTTGTGSSKQAHKVVAGIGRSGYLISLSPSHSYAIDQIDLSVYTTSAVTARATLYLWTRTSGAATCTAIDHGTAYPPPGFTATTYRELYFSSGSVQNLTFPVPLVIGTSASAVRCFGVRASSGTNTMYLAAGLSYHTLS